MSEEQQEGGWSGLTKTILGSVGTLVTAGGAWLGSQIFGGDKEESAQPAQTTAPAPVINITTNNSQQQAAAPAGGGKTVIIKEKEAAPAPPKKKTEKEALQEEPKW